MKTFLLLILLISPLLFADPETNLVLVGGGEMPEAAAKYIVQKGGGKEASVLYIRWATNPLLSEDKKEAPFNPKDNDLSIGGYGQIEEAVPRAELLLGKGREKLLQQIKKASVIFFAGGDQDFIMDVFKSDEERCKAATPPCIPLATLIKEKYRTGTVLSGTSAGTAIMSKVMITSDEDKGKLENYRFVDGLGLLPAHWIVDQHFNTVPGREKRMRAALEKYPKHIGLGVYEDSAVVFRNGSDFEVLGNKSKALIFDPITSQLPRMLLFDTVKSNRKPAHSSSH